MGLSTSESTSKYAKIFPRFGQQDPSYIDVDINLHPEILEKLVILTMSYVQDSTNNRYRTFGLVIKKEGASYLDSEALCVLNRYGFLSENEIFSTPSFSSPSRNIKYYSVVVKITYNYYMLKAQNLWEAFDNYYPYDLSETEEIEYLISNRGLLFA